MKANKTFNSINKHHRIQFQNERIYKENILAKKTLKVEEGFVEAYQTIWITKHETDITNKIPGTLNLELLSL